jgi:hypothetical protein
MASLTGLFNSPVILLAVHGYHPFTPDMNIFAGGYQSFIYPTPTTMTPIMSGYDPRLYISPFPTPYTPQTEEDKYLGIGKANPGTYYNNPGHLLSLMDTYARMSCGLRILQAIRDCSIESEFNGAVDHDVILNTTNGTTTINTLNLTENPSKYIIGHMIEDSDRLLHDPRLIQSYDESAGIGAQAFWNRMLPELTGNSYYHDQNDLYIPTTQIITFDGLFSNVLLSSYFGLSEQFHNIIDLLYNYASNLTNLNGGDIELYSQNVWTNRSNSKVNYCSESWGDYSPEGTAGNLIPETTPFPLPPPDGPNQNFGNNVWPSGGITDHSQALISPITSFDTLHFSAEDVRNGGTITEVPALIRSRYTRLNKTNAIKLLTGEDLHLFNSTTSTYEHKSFTELNGVINLIPVQSIGMRYTGRCHRLDLDANHHDGGHRWTYVRNWQGVPIDYVPPTNQRYELLTYPPCNFAVVYSITDICINITVLESSSVTISVTGSLDRAGRLDPHNHPLRSEALQLWGYDWISRKTALMTSVTNKYNWDRKWHDLLLDDTADIQTDEILIGNPTAPFSKRTTERVNLFNEKTGFWYWRDGPFIDYGGDVSFYGYYGQPPNWEEKTTFQLNSVLDLKPGCNCVRARFIVQNLNQRDALQLSDNKVFVDDLEADITVSISDDRIEPISHHFEIKNPPTQRLEELRRYIWSLP